MALHGDVALPANFVSDLPTYLTPNQQFMAAGTVTLAAANTDTGGTVVDPAATLAVWVAG